MAKQIRISESEWQVMELLWEKAPQLGSEIVNELAPRHDWSGNTVKTLLNRLVKKGALRFKEEGRAYLYQPAVQQTQCVREESRRFMDRVFGGSAAPLLMHFIEDAELNADEIKELKRLLDRKGK